ncbi:MAG TPA: hypothetical protein VH092_28120 [Urbifossiella sp.]|nr:hypothetical protein [Urbifossiella sp.]
MIDRLGACRSGRVFETRRGAASARNPGLPVPLGESERQDRAILAHLERADPAGYFAEIAAERDARRICGLPPTYMTLAAARPRVGRVLHYQQFVHPKGAESVSFAAAAFYE